MPSTSNTLASLEETAVEAQQLLVEDDGEIRAVLHFRKERAELGLETFGGAAQGFEQATKAVLRQEADILCEHAEEAAREKLRH